MTAARLTHLAGACLLLLAISGAEASRRALKQTTIGVSPVSELGAGISHAGSKGFLRQRAD